jgi:tetratricopeptide (TPR) repeat protein
MKRIVHTSLVFLLSVSAAVAAQARVQPAAPGQAQPGHSADSPAMQVVKQARELSSQGKQDEAIAAYQRALAMSPQLVEAEIGIGAALDLKGDYAQARQHFSKALDMAAPEAQPQVLRTMAVSYAFTREPNEAAKFEQRALDARLAANQFDNAAEIANELARVYLESGDVDNAYRWYERGHELGFRTQNLKPADKDLWDFRWEHAQARIAARRGQRDEAQKHVAAAKAILDKGTIPGQARFFPYLTGYVAFYGDDYKTALADLQQADQHDPFILSLIAQTYDKLGDDAQAKEFYRKILAINAHNVTNAFARPLAKQKLGS